MQGNIFLLKTKRLKLTVGKTIKSKYSIGNCKQMKRNASPAVCVVLSMLLSYKLTAPSN
jgi:hypothetical protein